MATFPSSNRPFPAYNTSYAYTAPPTAPSVYSQPANLGYPSPATMPYANPTASSRFFQALPQPHLPWLSNMLGQPQQPMVISVNAPKMSNEEAKKTFLLKVAATTTSFVLGIGILSFVALKLFPQRIAMEIGAQTHRSLMNTLDKKSVAEVLEKIKKGELGNDFETCKKLHDKWGHKNADTLYKNKKEYKQFTKDIEPHMQVSDTLGLFGKQLTRATFTPDFMQEQLISFCKKSLSLDAKQFLLDRILVNQEAKAALTNAGYAEGQKLAQFTENEQTKILNVAYKYTSFTDVMDSIASNSGKTALQAAFKDNFFLRQLMPSK